MISKGQVGKIQCAFSEVAFMNMVMGYQLKINAEVASFMRSNYFCTIAFQGMVAFSWQGIQFRDGREHPVRPEYGGGIDAHESRRKRALSFYQILKENQRK